MFLGSKISQLDDPQNVKVEKDKNSNALIGTSGKMDKRANKLCVSWRPRVFIWFLNLMSLRNVYKII